MRDRHWGGGPVLARRGLRLGLSLALRGARTRACSAGTRTRAGVGRAVREALLLLLLRLLLLLLLHMRGHASMAMV